MNDQLRFYVGELMAAHSHNYPLLYLSLRQLKQASGAEAIAGYKSQIASDPTKPDTSDSVNQKIIDMSSKYGGDTAAMMVIVAKARRLGMRRSKTFLEKIRTL
jgi:hypothetical protein